MKGMRNRLAHGYFDINLEVVWDTVQTALPGLLALCLRFGMQRLHPTAAMILAGSPHHLYFVNPSAG